MPITQEDVDRVLAMTRFHYRSNDALQSSIAATDAVPKMRSRLDSNKTMPEIGAFLVINGITAGHWREMTSVSSHFCVTDTQLAGKMVEMWVCQTPQNEARAHTLLIVSDGYSLSNIRPFSIEALADLNKKQGVWVIDPWLNVACHGSEYKNKMMEKYRDRGAHGAHFLTRSPEAGHKDEPLDQGNSYGGDGRYRRSGGPNDAC